MVLNVFTLNEKKVVVKGRRVRTAQGNNILFGSIFVYKV